MKLAIDVSRCRSGGAIAHIVGLITDGKPKESGISEVHIWGYKSLLKKIPDKSWLVKHESIFLELPLVFQLFWQAFLLPLEIKRSKCEILFSPDASTLCRFSPSIVLSQDLLSYEPGMTKLFGWGFARARLIAIFFVQNAAFRRAIGVIFLTNYAAQLVQNSCGKLRKIRVISHGVGHKFFRSFSEIESSLPMRSPIKCLYVSPITEFKKQREVVSAISQLRESGHDIELTLVGGSQQTSLRRLMDKLDRVDPRRKFIRYLPAVPQSELPKIIAESDVFVFASACENQPITLMEGMAAGSAVACSSSGPMPEVLQDAGVYFNPNKCKEISDAICKVISSPELANNLRLRARTLAEDYSWELCSRKTWDYISHCFHEYNNDVEKAGRNK